MLCCTQHKGRGYFQIEGTRFQEKGAHLTSSKIPRSAPKLQCLEIIGDFEN